MNKKMIVYILGKMMGVEGLLLLIPALVSLIYHEKSVISFLIVAAVLLVIYMVFGRKLPASKQIYGKEGFVIVGLAWILWSAFGALPFVISGSIPYYIDALFETISGLPFTYQLKRGRNGELTKELWIDRRKNSKSLAWSSVLKAFEKTEGKPVVSRPKALGDIRGVSYLYGIFYKFGLIDVPDDLLKKYQK